MKHEMFNKLLVPNCAKEKRNMEPGKASLPIVYIQRYISSLSLSLSLSHTHTHTQEENLCQTIAHGLQCVVKSKLDKAEIIFTQALQLPEFQRVPLKAFVYICLAVVANKRRKAG